MTTAGPPATSTALHRPVWITGLTIATAGAAGYGILLTLAMAGVGNHEQNEIRSLLRALFIVAIAVGSFMSIHVWSLRRRREAESTTDDDDDADANADLRRDIQSLGLLVHRTSGARDAVLDQVMDRLDWLVVKRTEEGETAAALAERVATVERALSAICSPNVFDIEAARDLRSIQQRFDEESP